MTLSRHEHDVVHPGTGNGLWISLDDGGSWRRLQSNLPHAPVHWLTIQERFDDLVVATYGRGFWILDDITPLRALAAGELDAFEFLPPRPAYRFQSREEPVSQPNDPAAGTNPEYGAVLHYHLAAEPEEDVKVEVRILRDGEEIAKLKDPPRTAGLHRVHWNLLYERSPEVKLRTRPDENPHVGFGEEGWRELADGGRVTLLAPPGTYEVELKVGEEKRTASLEVLKDPNSKASEADLTVQTSLLLTLRNLQTRVADLINDIERIRANIDTLAARLEAGEHEKAEELTTAAREVEERLKEVEGQFFDLRLTGAPQDSLRWKRLLYGQIANLAWMVGKGDYPPTDSQAAFALELAEQLEGHEAHFQEIRQAGLAELEEALRAAGVGAVVD